MSLPADDSSQSAMNMALGPGVSLISKSSSSATLDSSRDSGSSSSSSSSSDTNSGGDGVPEWKKKQQAARAAFRSQNNLDANSIEAKRSKKKVSDNTSVMGGGGVGLRRRG